MDTSSAAVVNANSKPVHTSPTLTHPAKKDEFPALPLKWLQASKTNPRKQFDGPEFDELVASIQRQGVLVPLLVRPLGKAQPGISFELYEVIAGERRFRAATKLGLVNVPVRIMDLNDEETLEVQIVENLQRKDVQPIEEARGFQVLLDSMQKAEPKRTRQELVGEIAKRVGKSPSHVHGRLQLKNLIPELSDVLAKGVIEAGHADLLKRLNPEQQKEIFEDYYAPDAPSYRKDNPPSVRSLKGEIEANYQPLKQAPFKQGDTKYGQACTGCEHNSATDGGDTKKATCANQECFDAKVEKFVQIESAALKAKHGRDLIKVCKSSYSAPKGALSSEHWKKAAAKSCDHVVPALVVSYESKPEGVTTVCAEKKCKVHFPKPESGSSSSNSSWEKQNAEREAKRKIAVAGDVAVFKAMVGKVKSLTMAELAPIVADLSHSVQDEDSVTAVCDLFGWTVPKGSYFRAIETLWEKNGAKFSGQQQAQFLFALAIGGYVGGYENDQKKLDAHAKSYKIDAATIRAKAIADATPKPTAQTSAKSSPTSPKAPAVKKSSPKKAKASSKKGGRK